MLKENDKSLFQKLGNSTTESENECVDKWESRSEKKETISGVVPLDSVTCTSNNNSSDLQTSQLKDS